MLNEIQDEATSEISAVHSLRAIPEGETFKRRDELVNEDTVRSTFAIRLSEGEARYEVQTLFDFSGVSREQLMLLCCTNGVVVWRQRVLRDMGQGMHNPANHNSVSVLEDVIEGENRVSISPEDRARRAVAKLTPEARAQLVAEFLNTI